MSDPFRQLVRGTPLSNISAEQLAGWNRASFRDHARGDPEDFAAGRYAATSTFIRILNDSGGGLDRFAVLRLSTALPTYAENADEFLSRPGAKGAAPGNPSDRDVIAILSDPLDDQVIGRAVIAGLTPVKIQIDSGQTGWNWADVTSGNTSHLVMKQFSGCARIVFKETGTGEKWALVDLLGPAASGLGLCGWDAAAGFDSGADGLVMTVNPATGCVVLVPAGECGDASPVNTFSTVHVSGQSDVIADSSADTLTLAAGSGMTITTNAGADSITFASHLVDGDYGDISISGSGTAINIDSASVTLAKMANLAQDQFIGRVTASTGPPETATITAAARTVLDDTSVDAMINTLGGASYTGSGGLARKVSPNFTTPNIDDASFTRLRAGASSVSIQADSADAATINFLAWNGSFNEYLFFIESEPSLGRVYGDLSTKVTQGGNFLFYEFMGPNVGKHVATADGGTGRGSATAYGLLCGGTTSTGAQQSLASLGTSGQLLQSNGAGALPSFATVTLPNSFTTLSVSGQSDVLADSTSDTLTLVAGSNMTITTDASTDTITFTASGGGSASDSFTTIAVSGQSDVVADSSTDTLTLHEGTGITITTDASTDTITIASHQAAWSIITVAGQDNVTADIVYDTLTLIAGANMTISTDSVASSITFTASGGGAASDSFTTIAVSGQSSVVADSSTDTLTLVAGAGLTITTNASTDTITFTSATPNTFSTIAVSGQSDVVADSGTDTLTLVAGTNISLVTNASTDAITIACTANTWTTIAVSGQTSLNPPSPGSALTLAAGANTTITTNSGSNTVTFSATAPTPPDVFKTISIAGQSDVVADSSTDTLTLVAGDGIAITTNASTDTITITNAANVFTQIAVSGQSNCVADGTADTLTFVAGSNMTITTDASTDTVTFTASGGGSASDSFTTIAVSGQSSVIADSSTDTLTLVAGANVTISTNASTDTITIAAAQNTFSTISVSGQSDVVADASADTLTFAAGDGIAITTNASTDTVTIANTANVFTQIAVSGQSTCVADGTSDTLTFVAGSNMTITTDASTDTVTFTAAGGGSASDSFTTIAVAGQSSVIADSSTDTLTLVAGANVTITTNASTDTITIAAGQNTFSTVSVSGQSDVVADASADTLTFAAGTGIAITTDAASDTVTIANTSLAFKTIAIAGQSDVVADALADTLTLVAGDGVTLTTNASTDTITITNQAPNTFSTIAVATQSSVLADSPTDTLTLVHGRGINIQTTASTDTITFTNTVYAFDVFSVSGQSDVIADAFGTNLTLANGTNIAVTTNASTDTITISITGIIQSSNGGTGNGFFKIAGPASSEKTYTVPNATCDILTDNSGSLTPLATLLALITGYDGSKSLTLNFDHGTLKWVEDGSC